jgi:hypothetical protein
VRATPPGLTASLRPDVCSDGPAPSAGQPRHPGSAPGVSSPPATPVAAPCLRKRVVPGCQGLEPGARGRRRSLFSNRYRSTPAVVRPQCPRRALTFPHGESHHFACRCRTALLPLASGERTTDDAACSPSHLSRQGAERASGGVATFRLFGPGRSPEQRPQYAVVVR